MWNAPALDGSNALGNKLLPAIDQARVFCAVLESLLWNRVIIGFVRLAEIGGISIWNRTIRTHPMQSGTGVETAGKGDADLVADREMLKNSRHLMMMVGIRLGRGVSHDVGRRQGGQLCFCRFEHRSHNDAHNKYDQTNCSFLHV